MRHREGAYYVITSRGQAKAVGSCDASGSEPGVHPEGSDGSPYYHAPNTRHNVRARRLRCKIDGQGVGMGGGDSLDDVTP